MHTVSCRGAILSGMNKRQLLILLVSILASGIAGLDGSIVGVALPAIARDLGGGLALQQWVTDAYFLTLGAFILLAGSLSDLFGRKRIMTLGLLGFGVASLLCALAPSGGFLIAVRAIQGIAGALLVPSSLAIIMSTFSGAEQARAIGRWTGWISIAFLIGPLLGGFLVDVASWRWIFAINVPIIAVTLALLARVKGLQETEARPRVDVLGALLCIVGLGAPVYALIEQPHYGWGSPVVWPLCALGVVVLVLFVWHESRASEPMMPLELYAARNFSVGNVATAAVYGALSLATFLITIFLQQVGGLSALRAGLALLPVTIIMFLLSSRFGALAGRFGPRIFMAIGPMVASVGFLYMLRVGTPVEYWLHLFPGVLLFALGLSMTVAPLTSAILGCIPARHAGIGSAVNNAVSRIAGLITVAAAGIVTGPHLDVPGFHRALILIAVLLVIGGLVSAWGIRRLPPLQPAETTP